MTTAQVFSPPYPPSWVDRFIGWIDRLPPPNWLCYAALIVIQYLVLNAALWLLGEQPAGHFDFTRTNVLPLVVIAWIHYTHHIAQQAIDQFKPALGGEQRDYELFKYRLTTIPARWALIVTLIDVVRTVSSTQAYFARALTPREWIIYAVVGVFSYGLILLLVCELIRQFIWIRRIHAAALHVNLFEQTALYAFSRLTVRAGVAFLILSSVILLVANPQAQPGTLDAWVLAAFPAVAVVLAVVCFVLPIYGMHQQMTNEKTRLLTEVNRRLEIAFQELHAGFDTKNYSQIDALNKMVTGLNVEHDTLNKLSTWPWQTSTGRGFAGALLLPIIIWLITRLLSRAGL